MIFSIDDVDISLEDIPFCLGSAELGSWAESKDLFQDSVGIPRPVDISLVVSEASELDSIK